MGGHKREVWLEVYISLFMGEAIREVWLEYISIYITKDSRILASSIRSSRG